MTAITSCYPCQRSRQKLVTTKVVLHLCLQSWRKPVTVTDWRQRHQSRTNLVVHIGKRIACSGPHLLYAALVASPDDRFNVAALTVDRQRAGCMWTELDHQTIWDQNNPSECCDVKEAASNDCFDAYPGCLVDISTKGTSKTWLRNSCLTGVMTELHSTTRGLSTNLGGRGSC